MPYLGPKSFDTTPLTSNNLAYLNNCLLSTGARDSSRMTNQANNQVNSQANNSRSVGNNNTNCSNKDTSTKGNSTNSTISNNDNSKNNNTDNNTDNNNNNSNNNDNNDNSNNNNNNINNNTLSTVSSTNSLSGLLTDSTLTSLGNSSQNENDSYTHTYSRTVIDDDDNKTEILPSTPRTVILPLDTNSISSKKLASVSSSSSHSSADLQLQLPSKLIRKKSGELVKSSLKLNSLKRSNSLPNTKNVRFASRLENVKFFHKSERPTAVSIENFPLISSTLKPVWEFNYSDEEEEDDDDFYSNLGASSSLSNEEPDKNSQKWEIIKNDCPYNPVSLNFTRLNNTSKNIILESIKLNSSKTSLIGFIYVKNLTFEKKIIVKFTIDDWQSFIEIENANYISSNHIFKYSDSESSNYDKFSFIIKLNTLSSFKKILNIKFCILYVANENFYWDNNYNKNYDILLKKIDKKNKIKPGNKNSDKSKYKFNEKEDLKIKSPILSDMDDIHFKLKNNNNFDDLLNKSNKSSQPNTNNIRMRNSKKFLIKKVKSESSLPTMTSSFSDLNPIKSQPIALSNSFSNCPVSSNNTSTTSSSSSKTPLIKKQYSKSAAPSPSLSANGFSLNPKDFQDYDKIVQQFCFFGSDIPNTNNNSSIYKSSFDRNTHELTTDLSSFCLN